MNVTGEMLIGASSLRGAAGSVAAFNPATNSNIEPSFGAAGLADVDRACSLAEAAFDSYRATSPDERARFLDEIARNLLGLGDNLYERGALETGLTVARIKGETLRTATQLNMFAEVVRKGRWRQATIDTAAPERQPSPKPDMRMHKVPLGPVGVFGASNFPVLYSVAGGDTASALAAGCPVVVKAHGSHLGTSELVGRAIQRAVKTCRLHEGVFSLLIGDGNAVGEALVDHPSIQAVAFTGSEGGGMALVRRGAERNVPIPVFAEMTSVNPNFFLPGALKARGKEMADGFVRQMALGAGQMCLKPGLILAVEGEDFARLRADLGAALEDKPAETMLSPGIFQNFNRSVERTRSGAGVKKIASGRAPAGLLEGYPEIFEIQGDELLANPTLANEMFGPAAVLVRCTDSAQLIDLARSFHGQLTMALHVESSDHALAQQLLPILERRTNRIIVNKFANVVEITNATIHGGPFPATSDPRFTSVGATAIERFLRPICYENVPESMLPPALRDENPLSLWRVVDGELGKH
ncbi:alpha-ketoglutaric semialdehyde dehydrogenase [Paraburkholderia sp. GAS448]|uniref:aldehyde dehydrogenase (NADP(+)) n=1 Tax=Paraburkholderia sp. GAS448 TaxID=3035136 RepID=UPI003D1DE8E4